MGLAVGVPSRHVEGIHSALQRRCLRSRRAWRLREGATRCEVVVRSRCFRHGLLRHASSALSWGVLVRLEVDFLCAGKAHRGFAARPLLSEFGVNRAWGGEGPSVAARCGCAEAALC